MQVSTCMMQRPVLATTIPVPASCRARLLQAATEVFSERGFQAATTREIAQRAEVNEVTLFRHFRTRRELMRAVVEQILQAEVAFMARFTLQTGDFRTALREYTEAYLELVERRQGIVRAILGEGHLLPPEVQQTVVDLLAPVKRQLAEWIASLQHNGSVRSDVDPLAAIEMMRDALQTAVLRWRGPFKNLGGPRDIYLENFLEIYARGLETKSSGKGGKASDGSTN
ncbi:MAG TPA: helix-turn-helix domain-containing protein [Chthoniobacterales bacterium]